MAKFKGAVLICRVCSSEFRVPPSRAATATTCSNACAKSVRAENIKRKVTVKCRHCSQGFEVPRCHADRRVYCSRACMEASPAIAAPKAARAGDKNGAWKGGRPPRKDGYVYARAAGHPYGGSNGYVLEHRKVMEDWLVENDPRSPYLTKVDGVLRLSPEFHVHHKDETRTNNVIGNLQCMTPAEHRAHHQAIIAKALAFYRKHFPAGGPEWQGD